MVSICCISYNHEKFIRNALDGFIMQKTNFKYEILIHDDASTDNTAQIIREYERKYPDLIFPIYQLENKYSKGHNPTIDFNLPRAKGKYIALCEGDDYWTDPLKLQKQFDIINKNPGCNLVVHRAQKINTDNTVTGLTRENNEVKFYPQDILNTNGQFAPTASYFFVKENIKDYSDIIRNAPFGDFFVELFSVRKGYGYYMSEVMSGYRINTENSWTRNVYGVTSKRLSFNQALIKSLYDTKRIFNSEALNPLFINKIVLRHFYCLNCAINLFDYQTYIKNYKSIKQLNHQRNLIYKLGSFSKLSFYAIAILNYLKKKLLK